MANLAEELVNPVQLHMARAFLEIYTYQLIK